MGSPVHRSAAEVQTLMQGLAKRDLLRVVTQVCRAYNVTIEDVLARHRHTRVVRARDACIHKLLATPMSSPEVGILFGMDHTSVLAARDRYKKRDNGRLLT